MRCRQAAEKGVLWRFPQRSRDVGPGFRDCGKTPKLVSPERAQVNSRGQRPRNAARGRLTLKGSMGSRPLETKGNRPLQGRQCGVGRRPGALPPAIQLVPCGDNRCGLRRPFFRSLFGPARAGLNASSTSFYRTVSSPLSVFCRIGEVWD